MREKLKKGEGLFMGVGIEGERVEDGGGWGGGCGVHHPWWWLLVVVVAFVVCSYGSTATTQP